MKQKTCIGGGIYNFDIIVERSYLEGFVVGKRKKFSERILSEEIGGTCGNVMCMLPYPYHYSKIENKWNYFITEHPFFSINSISVMPLRVMAK